MNNGERLLEYLIFCDFSMVWALDGFSDCISSRTLISYINTFQILQTPQNQNHPPTSRTDFNKICNSFFSRRKPSKFCSSFFFSSPPPVATWIASILLIKSFIAISKEGVLEVSTHTCAGLFFFLFVRLVEFDLFACQ